MKNFDKRECFNPKVLFSCKHSVLSELFITLLMEEYVGKRNNEDLEELPSTKKQKSSDGEGTCCYHSKEHD